MFLDMKGTAAYVAHERPLAKYPCPRLKLKWLRVIVGFVKNSGRVEDIPQRLHSVCVLLWRFPKEEVPFAIVAHQ